MFHSLSLAFDYCSIGWFIDHFLAIPTMSVCRQGVNGMTNASVV